MLGDEIMVEYGPDSKSLARVVAIGLDLVCDETEQKYYSWVKRDGIINKDSIIAEWIDKNPLSHNDQNFAPVSNYTILGCICCEMFIRRGGKAANKEIPTPIRPHLVKNKTIPPTKRR